MPVFKPQPKEEPIDIWNVKLPLMAVWGIYARQFTPAQLVKNTQSTEMQTDDLKQWLYDKSLDPRKIFLFDADLGVSGTLRIDQRTGLQELVVRMRRERYRSFLSIRFRGFSEMRRGCSTIPLPLSAKSITAYW